MPLNDPFNRQYDVGEGVVFDEQTGILTGSDDPTVTDITLGTAIPISTIYIRTGQATPTVYIKSDTGALDWEIVHPSFTDRLYRHNGGTTQALTGTEVTALFPTSVRQDSIFSYSAGEITINKTGWFKITTEITVVHVGAGQDSGVNGVIQLNGSDITGSEFQIDLNKDVDGQTSTASILVNITSGSVIRVRIQANLRNPATVSNSCRILIQEVDSP